MVSRVSVTLKPRREEMEREIKLEIEELEERIAPSALIIEAGLRKHNFPVRSPNAENGLAIADVESDVLTLRNNS
jgi:hypothetical protein